MKDTTLLKQQTSPLEQENEHSKNQVSLVENNSIVLSNSSYLKNTNEVVDAVEKQLHKMEQY